VFEGRVPVRGCVRTYSTRCPVHQHMPHHLARAPKRTRPTLIRWASAHDGVALQMYRPHESSPRPCLSLRILALFEFSWSHHCIDFDVDGRSICTGDPSLRLLMMGPGSDGQSKDSYAATPLFAARKALKVLKPFFPPSPTNPSSPCSLYDARHRI